MQIKFILFLGIMLTLILGLHVAVFRSALYFFQISRPVLKSTLYTAMIWLSFSFISAFFLLHWRENAWTIGYYKFAAIWTGFLIHFAVAVAGVWTFICMGRMAGYPFNSRPLAAVFLIAAAFGSIFGMWSSFHPVVRKATVSIKNLPRNWEGRTLAQLSDIHLGHFYGKKFAERIVRQVNALKPDLIVVTGDILDGMGGNFEQQIEPLKELSAPLGKYAVTGNHEYYIGMDRALGILNKTRLQILNNERVHINDLDLVGVGYPGIRRLEEIKNLPVNNLPAVPRILLFHTPTNLQVNTDVQSDGHFKTYWMPDTSYTLNKALKIDLQLSGHTHHGQIFPFNFLTGWLFKGYDYGLNQDSGFQLYTSGGTGSWGPPMRTSGRPEIVLITLTGSSSQ
jgi:uncharacterized protein